jgi:hypothetical protein
LDHKNAFVLLQDASSLKMLINGKKVEKDADLSSVLSTKTCVVVVEQKPKINITVSELSTTGNDAFPLTVFIHR